VGHVEAKDGVVTVGDHVRNAEEKKRVVETIKDIRVVDKVLDQLRVQP
jgi:osmotically-inducible protein OsmY